MPCHIICRLFVRCVIASSVIFALLGLALPIQAVPANLNMGLLPTTTTVNRLNVTVSSSGLSDSELTRLAGNILTTVDYDIVNNLPRINTIQFTGGSISISGASTANVLMTLDAGFLGKVDITGTGVGGRLETPVPPSIVTSGQFPTQDHQVRLNQGTLSAVGSGLLFSSINTNINLATPANNITLTQNDGLGTIAIQQVSVNGLNRTFQATLTLPLAGEQTIPNFTPDTTVGAVGNITAQANFVVAFPLEGDYNRDDIVDAADYALWRDSLDQTGVGLRADGNTDLTVNATDYDIWKSNFGSIPPGAGGSTAIPEPSTLLLCLAAFAACCLRRRLS